MTTIKSTINWLIEDTHIFRYQYLRCDLTERHKYKNMLLRYQSRFKNKGGFLKWYLKIIS